MADNTEIDDRVDLDDDNYIEEDDDVEEQIEDEGAGEEAEENGEDQVDQHEDLQSGDSGKELLFEGNGNDIGAEPVKNIEKPNTSNNAVDNDKHAELLSLPPHGSEVFIGGLSRGVSEVDLRDLCESIGEIFEIRLMKNRDTGESKGFAFVAFKTKDVAQKAIEVLHNKEFKGRTIRCSLSETKYRLFIGNIPKILTDNDFRKVIDETGPGAETIELIKDPHNPSRNRGFGFVEYYNNACADYSRQKMSNANFKLEGNTPTVTWADPKITPDHSAAAAQTDLIPRHPHVENVNLKPVEGLDKPLIRALYVKNIPENTSIEQLKELFQRHGEVTKVVMPPAKSGGKRDFGFVHYAERSSALKAIKETEKYETNGQILEVVLAKPQSEKKFDVAHSPSSARHPNFIPPPGFGSFPVVAPGHGAAAGYQQQPVIYGRGPMPAGMQMVPMVLPDGQIGYVLQQPGLQMPPVRPRRNDRGNGTGRGSSGSSDDIGRYRRYRPY